MKQIFDWLREQINKNIYSIPLQNNHGVKFKAIDVADVENLINEAEGKWESEVCEWKYHVAPSKDIYFLTSCNHRHNGRLSGNRPYCGFCGKPIKISEVE